MTNDEGLSRCTGPPPAPHLLPLGACLRGHGDRPVGRPGRMPSRARPEDSGGQQTPDQGTKEPDPDNSPDPAGRHRALCLPSQQAVRTPSRSLQAKESRSAQRRHFSVPADSNLQRTARRPVTSSRERQIRPRARPLRRSWKVTTASGTLTDLEGGSDLCAPLRRVLTSRRAPSLQGLPGAGPHPLPGIRAEPTKDRRPDGHGTAERNETWGNCTNRRTPHTRAKFPARSSTAGPCPGTGAETRKVQWTRWVTTPFDWYVLEVPHVPGDRKERGRPQ